MRFGKDIAVAPCNKQYSTLLCLPGSIFPGTYWKKVIVPSLKKKNKQIKPAVCLPIIFLQSFNSQEQTTAFYYVTLNWCQPGPTSLPDINGPDLIPITQAAASQRGNTSEERSEFSFYIKRKHTCIHIYIWWSTIAVLYLTSQDCRAWASTCNTPEIRLLTVMVQTHIF